MWRRLGSQVFLISAVVLGIFGAGVVRQLASSGIPEGDVSAYADGALVTVRGAVASEPEIRGRIISLVLSASSIERGGQPAAACSGLVSCSFVRDERSGLPEYGDGITARGVLDLPSSAANPGGFDERAHLAARGIYSTLFVRRAGAWLVVGEDADAAPHRRLAGHIRRSLSETTARYLKPAEAGLLAGIMIGSRTQLPPQIQDDFQLTGTSHVLATAGLHVGVTALLILGTLRLIGIPRNFSAGVCMVLLLGYAVIAGGRPSVVRAVVVADILLAGTLLQREVDAANSLSAAALVLLAVNPGNLFDPGFQLSFATVASIAMILSLVSPWTARWFRDTKRVGRQRLSVRTKQFSSKILLMTIAAQIGSAPLVARYFNSLSLSGLPANLIIVPLLFPILGMGFILWFSAAIGLPCVPAACGWMLHYLLSIVMGAARTCSQIPFAALPVASPGWPVILGFYAALGALAVAARRRRRPMSSFESDIDGAAWDDAAR
jgi:competence protein ComEC